MKAAAFDYAAPRHLDEALALLSDGGEEARILAGGQSLGPMLNLRLARPALLIDVTRIAALKRVEDRAGETFIDAAVTHSAIEDRRHAFSDRGMLAAVAHRIAYRAVRNRGTIGGSVAHADPAADWPAALAALDAEFVLAGKGGTRRVALRDFLRGAFATSLEPGEIVEGIAVPKLSAGARWGYYKLCRKPGEFADAIGAVVADPRRKSCRIVMGATSGAPAALDGLAALVADGGAAAASTTAIRQAVAAAAPGLDALDARLHAVAISRALQQAFAP